MGPLSPRVDFLTAAIRIAEAAPGLSGAATGIAGPAVDRLLRRFAMNIPVRRTGRRNGDRRRRPATIAVAAQAELDIHSARDQADRQQASVRAMRQLDDAEQLFGTRLAAVDHTGTGRQLGPGPSLHLLAEDNRMT